MILQSGHCFLEQFSQSSKIWVLFISAINSCDSFLNLLIFCVWLKSWRKDSLCWWFSNFSIKISTSFSRVVSCCSTVERCMPRILLSKALFPVSLQLFDSLGGSQDDLASWSRWSCWPLCEVALSTTRGNLGVKHTFIYYVELLLRFHAYRFLNANGGQCVVENDCMRPCLVKIAILPPEGALKLHPYTVILKSFQSLSDHCEAPSNFFFLHSSIDLKKSGLTIRANYRHFRTICEQTVDYSPTDPIFSSLNWWSSKQCCDFVSLLRCFVRQLSRSVHALLCMTFLVIRPWRDSVHVKFPSDFCFW